jgi:hypothetical protein
LKKCPETVTLRSRIASEVYQENIWIFAIINMIEHMKRLVVILLCSAVLFASCDFVHGKRIKGSGNVITQTRNLSGFNAIEAGGAVHVYVKQDPAFSVQVKVDDNLQQYVIVEEENGVLMIHQQNNTSLQTTEDLKVYVTLPSLKDLVVSGASSVTGENAFTGESIRINLSGASHADMKLDFPNVSAELSGASKATFSGKTKDIKLSASGASTVKAFELFSETAVVELSGASDANVFASLKLDAGASGASNLRYKGEATVNKSESGAGSVSKAD